VRGESGGEEPNARQGLALRLREFEFEITALFEPGRLPPSRV
jgi:hypothetical protein